MALIRNFCIIAHIDHGKSTLADRFLELTGTVSKREMREQMLDMMDLERERGITIKLQPVRMIYKLKGIPSVAALPRDDNGVVTLNLIDTPGHVDFTYEVSRSLAAVEGAILLVDASQGVQAQTIANLYLALAQNLTIIPVINKIDLPNAHVAETKEEMVSILGCKLEDILLVSAKTGEGVEQVLSAVIKRVPEPKQDAGKLLRALVFDSIFDEYKGVVAYARIIEGEVQAGNKILMLGTKAKAESVEVGYFSPLRQPAAKLSAGEIGYIATGLKEIGNCRVGDTITLAMAEAMVASHPGYQQAQPMVFAGVFCKEGSDFQRLRLALEKLKLNDAALSFEPEHSPALGAGFRCGLLGLLHLDIMQERLRREYGLELVITNPSVGYRAIKQTGEEIFVKSPQDLPEQQRIKTVLEPWVKMDIVTPPEYLGPVMGLAQQRRGAYLNTEYLGSKKLQRAILHYKIPLSQILVDFFDQLKAASAGYASFNYEFIGYEPTEVLRLDILVANEVIEPLASIVYRDEAASRGRQIVEKLKFLLPRQMFEVKLQATVGGKILASEKIPARRKDVTAKLYGGDVTRKMKLLEKQKKGKKRMMKIGKVDIPPAAFLAVLKK